MLAPGAAAARGFVPPGLLAGAAANPSQTVHVIVAAAPGVSTDRLKGLKDATGNQLMHVRREFKWVGAVAVDVTGAQLLALAGKDGIHSITPDGRVEKTTAFAPRELWPLVVGANELWPATPAAGTGPAIAIVDSGVSDKVADFEGRVTDNVNFSSFKQSLKDDFGHGTLVAGIAAGASASYPGVAPRARIISLRVTGPRGESITSDVLAALNWIHENRISKGIGVVNLSVRSTYPNFGLYDPLNLAVESLWHTGTVIVASAGNGGRERMLYAPASDPFVITVGAVDLNGTRETADDVNAPWTSHGYTAEGFAKPEVGAPGRLMVGPSAPASFLSATFPARFVAPGYMWMSGTSFAAPVVAGAAAQILARHPDWSPNQVKGALMATARPLPGAVPLSVGVGQIDAAAAAAVVNPPDPHANLAPHVKADSTGRAYFDASAWRARVSADASWTSASWTSASWTSASWTSASWTSASWTSASWTSAAYADASWTSASWTSASWTSASWTSASWTSASWTSTSDVA